VSEPVSARGPRGRVVVVGGGVSGLACAFHLRERGFEVQLLEATDRLGGVIRSERVGPYLLEHAANGVLDNEPATLRLVEALGLSGDFRRAEDTAKERYVLIGGRLRKVPGSPPGLLASDILPWGAKLRVLGDLFARRAKGEDESLADFGRRHIGPTATALLLDAVQTGIFAGDVERLSLRATFPKMWQLEREHRSLILGALKRAGKVKASRLHSLKGGMQQLVEALAQRLGPAARTGSRVTALLPREEGWQIEREGGPALQADQVVVALPAGPAAELLRGLSPEAASELERIAYAPVAVVHLGYPAKALAHRPQGFGFLVPKREGRPLLGTLYISSFFPWRADPEHVLVTCMVGGARSPELAALPPKALVALASEELERVLGLGAAPSFSQVVQWERAIAQYNVGHLARVERIDQALQAFPNLSVVGSALRGVGVNDCVRGAEQLAQRLAG
jgi:protoporphyrinogen/coproporphyrinogen III oxidase